MGSLACLLQFDDRLVVDVVAQLANQFSKYIEVVFLGSGSHCPDLTDETLLVDLKTFFSESLLVLLEHAVLGVHLCHEQVLHSKER